MINTNEICDRCGEMMIDIQVCHLLCPRCGSVMDCSDKSQSNNKDSTW